VGIRAGSCHAQASNEGAGGSRAQGIRAEAQAREAGAEGDRAEAQAGGSGSEAETREASSDADGP
jgi:hypothetical protein